MIAVRDLRAADAARWRELWDGYTAFYAVDVPEATTAFTWRRLLDPASPLHGLVVETDGRVAGFAHYLLHDATWATTPSCYLEDLFVDETVRGAGAGRALIDELIARGRASGWSRIDWHTDRSNATARRLYDRYIAADDFVRYRLTL